jgi:hypothetical protein
MLIITRRQFEAFSKAQIQGFTTRAIEHLRKHHPLWCGARDDEALAASVAATMAFAREHGVTHEANILQVMDLHVRQRFVIPLSGYPLYRLTQHGLDETTRVRNFASALALAQTPTVISLGTNLDAQEHSHV